MALAAAGLLLATSTIGGKAALRMRLSPPVSIAPAFLTIELSVEDHEDNRFLEVVAESEDFYRSSRVPLDGQNGPRLNVITFRNLPTGVYQVTGVLIGSTGPRGTASAVARVAPAVGSAR